MKSSVEIGKLNYYEWAWSSSISSLTISMLCIGPKGIIAALSDDSVTSSARPPTYNDLLECRTGSDEDAMMRCISIDISLED